MKIANLAIAATLTIGSVAIAQDVKVVDIDADGVISVEELMAAYDDVNEDIFTASDTNGDGVLDMDELASAQEDGLIPSGEM
ncbi:MULTISPECIES: EF-hand domain-containing protein [Maritimibacter]|nr:MULTISPECIES: EF-hand domain-containing protein [Maritimibacter]MBL6427486.1 EF-hand domain-containing protein [Maritimibacter sp.]TYP84529.1 EF hand domain-containing protein [Maritimibacter alkaliphilus HTCC2654]